MHSVSTPRSSNRTCPFRASGFRSRGFMLALTKVSLERLQSQQSKLLMEIHRCLSHWLDSPTEMLSVQPLTQPMSSVVIHGPIRSADRAKAKVIAPTAQGSIQVFNQDRNRLPIGRPLGHLADGLADRSHSFGRRPCPNEGTCTPGRVTPSQGGGLPRKLITRSKLMRASASAIPH